MSQVVALATWARGDRAVLDTGELATVERVRIGRGTVVVRVDGAAVTRSVRPEALRDANPDPDASSLTGFSSRGKGKGKGAYKLQCWAPPALASAVAAYAAREGLSATAAVRELLARGVRR